MKKVLIIGANSYIGNSFIQYIHELDDKDFIIDKISARHKEWERYDFTGYDVILHLAGIAHRRETRENAAEYYKVNKELAVDIAQKAKTSHVGQFIFMSTAAVYGSKASIITKNTFPCPDTHYGKSKLEAEQKIIDLYDDEFKIAIVRPPMVYGYGCKGNFQRLVKLSRITPVFPDIQNKRSMIYIENLCEFLRLLIEQEEWGYFHPQNEEYVCTSEMVRIIGESMDKKIYFTKIFNPVIKALSKKVPAVGKMFGDWYYEDEGLKKNNEPLEITTIRHYTTIDFKLSIQRSVYF